jgi:hypothetical protein
MTKKYSKKKDKSKDPTAGGPKYRTPSKFIDSKFAKGPRNQNKGRVHIPKKGQYKTQHRG